MNLAGVFSAVVPMACVTAAAIAAMTRRGVPRAAASGCRSAPLGVIGLVGAALSHRSLLWNRDASRASASSWPTTSALFVDRRAGRRRHAVAGHLGADARARRLPGGEYYALMLFATRRHDADGDGDRPAGHLPGARGPVARRLRADRHPARFAEPRPRRPSSTSCSARSRARSSSTASRSPTA